jgi:hypothetical protein
MTLRCSLLFSSAPQYFILEFPVTVRGFARSFCTTYRHASRAHGWQATQYIPDWDIVGTRSRHICRVRRCECMVKLDLIDRSAVITVRAAQGYISTLFDHEGCLFVCTRQPRFMLLILSNEFGSHAPEVQVFQPFVHPLANHIYAYASGAGINLYNANVVQYPGISIKSS